MGLFKWLDDKLTKVIELCIEGENCSNEPKIIKVQHSKDDDIFTKFAKICVDGEDMNYAPEDDSLHNSPMHSDLIGNVWHTHS